MDGFGSHYSVQDNVSSISMKVFERCVDVDCYSQVKFSKNGLISAWSSYDRKV